ncbi:hypothetical protein [Streptosporangium sp. NPDC002524]|uniref:hypothetical protein n=1 Tax=Streptosporangium sp. NPDC002524 TaxID=3154537 RepID=UPI003322F993
MDILELDRRAGDPLRKVAATATATVTATATGGAPVRRKPVTPLGRSPRRTP